MVVVVVAAALSEVKGWFPSHFCFWDEKAQQHSKSYSTTAPTTTATTTTRIIRELLCPGIVDIWLGIITGPSHRDVSTLLRLSLPAPAA